MTTEQHLNIALLSHSPTFYTTRRLLEAGRGLGHAMRVIDPLRVVIRTTREGAVSLEDDGEAIDAVDSSDASDLIDLIIPRVGATLTHWGLCLLRALVAGGAKSPITADAIAGAADKLATQLRMIQAGLPTVPTVAVRERHHIEDALGAAGSGPKIIKLPFGTQGQTVTLAPDDRCARSILDLIVNQGQIALVQPQLRPHEETRDLRILIANGRPLAACWRYARPGEFRSNVHRGGTTEVAKPHADRLALAVAAAEAANLPCCGVDLIEDDDGRLCVLEVNASPGLEGVEAATGRDLATPWLQACIEAAGL